MESILKFFSDATESLPKFLAYFSFFNFGLYFGLNAAIKIWTRVLRFLMVSFRGWPPAHLDADGDFDSYETSEHE